MLNLATKLLLALAAVAVALGTGYGVAVGERSGMTLLFFLALAAVVAGLAAVVVHDVPPVVPTDAPPPERRAATVGTPARGSGWPLAAAVAVTILAAAAALGTRVVIGGVVAVLAATAGWFGRVWSEHPSWTPRARERASSRLLVPVGLPVAMVLLALAIAVSLSRVLLAIPERAAVMVALVAALVIMGICSWVASRPRLGSSALVALAAVAGVSMVGAGIAGALSGEREIEHHESDENLIHLSARNTKFSRDRLEVPAHDEVTIEFDNKDDVFHNVAVYRGEGLTATPVFNGEGFVGDDERTYELHTPAPGIYTFLCDFHPTTMKGELVVEPGPTGPPHRRRG